jgi:hypothetical protein
LAQFQNAPANRHYEAAKRIVKYLHGSPKVGIAYYHSKEPAFIAYTDSNWASPKSRSGYIAFLGLSPIDWKTSRQNVVAQSSCEAEYVALALSCKRILWYQRIYQFLYPEATKPTAIFCDNQSAIKLAQAESIPAKSRHFELKYHPVKDLIGKNTPALNYVASEDNAADCLTKPLGSSHFSKALT